MLADSKRPTTFWAEAVNTACYVQNRVLVIKPHNKTPYELFLGRKPALGFMRPFGYPVTILNTIYQLGKFDGKADEGFFVGENTSNIVESGPNWLFDIDALTKSMNYKPVVAGNQSNGNEGTKACDDVGKARREIVPGKDYILLPLWPTDLLPSGDNEKKVTKKPRKKGGDPSNKNDSVNSTNNINTASDGNTTNYVNTVSSTVNTAGIEVNVVSSNTSIELLNDPNMPELEDIVYSDDYEDVAWMSKSDFLCGKIEEEVYVYQPPRFEDLDFPDRVKPDGEKWMYPFIIVSMIGSLMYLTSSRPGACARYQVNPKVSHLHAVKRIFRACLDSDVYKQREAEVNVGSQVNAALGFTLLLLLKKFILLALLTTDSETLMSYIALVYGKKINCYKASVRRDLQLNDEEGTNCLPNATIFEELTRMGYEKLSQKLTFYKAFFSPQWKFLIHTILQCLSAKTTAWNEFSSTMASAIICLAINQKFNFSKYIFESMVKNLENVSGKFLMYPRFVQVFLEKQLEGMSNHKKIYITPSHTKKIFRNIRKVGKGFSRRETPLFPTMMVQAQEETGEGSANPTDPHHTPTVIQPSTSQPQKKQKPRNPKRKDTEVPQLNGLTDNEEMDDSSGPRRQETIGDTIAQIGLRNVSKTSNDLLLAGVNTPRSDEDRLKIKELMELCTNLQNRVIDLEKTKTSQAQGGFQSLKRRVKRLEKKGGSRTYELKRLYKVGLSRRVKSSDEEGINLVPYTHFDGDTNMFRVHDLVDDEVVVEREVDVKAASTIPVSVLRIQLQTTVITDDEITLAKALAELRSAKLPTTTAATTIIAASIRPKALKSLLFLCQNHMSKHLLPTGFFKQKLQLNVQD
ncbi:ribonuclease H-like domain-containing protein [Tanacetum coccineum]